jgi:hypothetical protein
MGCILDPIPEGQLVRSTYFKDAYAWIFFLRQVHESAFRTQRGPQLSVSHTGRILLANWVAHPVSAAKRDVRVLARGTPSHQATNRSRLIATAVAT